MYTNKFLLNRLKRYSRYTEEYSGVLFTYEFDSPELHDLYCLQNLAIYGDGRKFKTLLNVMHHVFDSLYVKNSEEKFKNIVAFSAKDVFDMAKSKQYKFSCWIYAVTLTECFLSMGVPARMVRCFSGLHRDRECHCVTVAYCDEYKKFILFDVANNTVYYSSQGTPLSLADLRENIINNKRIIVLQSKNGEKEAILHYWIKNIMIFQCYEKSRYGNELSISNNRIVSLYPIGLLIRKRLLPIKPNYRCVYTRCDDEFWSLPI